MIRITDGKYIRNVYGIPVVADIFRATTNIVVMFMKGAEEVIPVSSYEEAFSLKRDGYIIFGEENTEKIEGFDYGNSPSETFTLDLKGKKAAIKTTNGSDVILKAGEGALIGSFLNIDALSRYLRNKEVHIFPANVKGGKATEDNEFAYALSKLILEPGADISVNLEMSRNGNGAERLKNHNLEKDIEFSLQRGITDIIPIYSKGKIIRMQ